MDRRTKRRLAIALLFLALGIIGYGIVFTPLWGIYVEYSLKSVIEPVGIFRLPPLVSIPLAIIAIMFPLFILSSVIGLIARPFVRLKETELAAEYLNDISSALSKLKSASTYFQELALSVESQAATVDALKNEVKALQELKEEDAKRLKMKFRVVSGISIPMLVLSYLFVFVFGVATSVTATYLTDYLKAIDRWPFN